MRLPHPPLPTHTRSAPSPADPGRLRSYTFDTLGWLVIPSVLTPEEAAMYREAARHAKAAGYAWGQNEPFHLPKDDDGLNLATSPVGGRLSELCDHPALVGFM